MAEQTPPHPLPPNTVRACIIPGADADVADYIRPCSPKRNWMEETHQKYAYRCIPLLAANTMGWEVLNPVTSTVRWNGGPTNIDLSVKGERNHPCAALSHFGRGIVTWYLPFLFRTSPDLGLVVAGPANMERDDAVPLDAFVRTDWLPFPFTMNWRLTREDTEVTFEKGEPICRIYPFPIELLDQTRLELTNLTDDPGFLDATNEFAKARQANVAKVQADAEKREKTGEPISSDGVWNSQYARAKSATQGSGLLPHQTVFNCQEPEDKRG
ncbi:MAG: DUF6065 family protein [Pseudomonadota bacterium]